MRARRHKRMLAKRYAYLLERQAVLDELMAHLRAVMFEEQADNL